MLRALALLGLTLASLGVIAREVRADLVHPPSRPGWQLAQDGADASQAISP